MDENAVRHTVGRRTVLKWTLAAAAGGWRPQVCSRCTLAWGRSPGVSHPQAVLEAGTPPVRFGMITDCHYADVDPAGTRFYRQSLDKLAECVDRMNAEKVDFLIELGDFKDQGRPPAEQNTLAYLQEVEAVFQRFGGPTYHVLGNHDVDSISKAQFLARVSNARIDPGRSYYSFDVKGVHCIVLDANYRSDGVDYDHGDFDWTDANVPAHELDWLRKDLADAPGPAVVFIHQLLDGTDSVAVRNAQQVRTILEESDKVQVVFQGHHHEGRYRRIGSIHYYTLRAVVEGQGADSNSYVIVEVADVPPIHILGYRRAVSATLWSVVTP